jgi:N-acetylmuramoyl-L-alanine amidase
MSKLVALDDGHGPETAGKRTPDGIRENQFNAPAMGFCAAALQRSGVRVMFTAPEDTDAPLATRVKRANDAKADIFVSIHFNAFKGNWDEVQGGIETHYYPGSIEGWKLATAVQKHVRMGTPQLDRGIKASSFVVLRDTIMPSIVIENGFMDVRKEAELMLNKEYQKEQGEQTAMGICEYLGVQYVPETPPNWKEQAMKRLVDEGLINSPHNPDSTPTWAELAAVALKVLDRVK